MANLIFVSGLQDEVTPDIVEQYFNTFGQVAKVDIGLDDANGTSAMVWFQDEVTVPIVLAITDHQILGSPIQILTNEMVDVEPFVEQIDEPPVEEPNKHEKELRELAEELKNKRKSAEIEERRLNAKKM